MSDTRAEFEKFWRKEMNTKDMPLYRTEFPMTEYSDQAYSFHETNRSWLSWQASRQALDSGEPFAYAHEDENRKDFITSKVKAFLSGLANHGGGFHRPVDIGERYTIPLYHHPASCSEIANSLDPASCPEIPDSCGPASADGAEVWEKAMMAAIGEDGPRSVADAISKLKAERVPDVEYFRALQDAFYIIQADANTEQNYGSLCRIGSVLAKLKATNTADDPDMCWDYEGRIDHFGDINSVAHDFSEGLDPNSSGIIKVRCANQMPDRWLQVTLMDDGIDRQEVKWQWVEQPKEEGE